MSKLRMTHEEKELCGLTPSAVEMPSDDELGAKSALSRRGFVPMEEIGSELVEANGLMGLISVSHLRDCMDPLEFIELRIDPEHYGEQPLARNMRPV